DPDLAQRGAVRGDEEAADHRVLDAGPGAPLHERLGGGEGDDAHRGQRPRVGREVDGGGGPVGQDLAEPSDSGEGGRGGVRGLDAGHGIWIGRLPIGLEARNAGGPRGYARVTILRAAATPLSR